MYYIPYSKAHGKIPMGVFVQISSTNVDIASVAPKFHLYTRAELDEVIGRL